MLTTFKNLKTFQLAEYIFLALFAFFIPMSWRIATYAMIAIFICTIIRIILEDNFRINNLQYKNRIVYFFFIIFWLLYAISFLYSENTTEARFQISKKISFLLFPLFFLFSNLSYLTKDRIRTIMYCFVIGILTLFVINLVWAGYDVLFEGEKIERITSPHKFFKTNDRIFTSMHRAYFSLITCLGLVFCFVELMETRNVKLKIFNTITLIILFFSPFFVYSRAGILCTIIVLFVLWFWLTFILKNKKIGIITCFIFLASLILGYFVFPKTIKRFTDAIENIKNGKGDCRLTIRNANRYVIHENFLFGVGSGDRNDKTLDSYRRYKESISDNMKAVDLDDAKLFELNKQILLDSINSKFENKYNSEVYKYIDSIGDAYGVNYSSLKDNLPEYQIIKHCIKHKLNAHNQFSDTIIAVGLLGLILFLLMLIAPVYLWIKNKSFDIVFFSLLVIIAFNSLFESVLERQMGIMFFTFFYFLLFHGNFCQQTTDNKTLSDNSN